MQTTPTDVARYYDAWTENYISAFGACLQAHRPESDEFFLDYLMDRIGLKPGMRALDAGCGVCGPARHFAARSGASIDAVTISPVQVNMAQEANEAAGLSQKIHVRLGDYHQLENLYEPESFDVVYFLESLSHSADPSRVLRSVYQVLRPGGHVYIKDFFVRPCDTEQKQQEVLEVISRVNRLFAVETAWAEEIVQSLRGAGLVEVFQERPQFAVDNTRWQAFERVHQIDLFDGKDSFDWSEWFEMKFQKPNN